MLASPNLPGWSVEELERRASEVLDREGRLVFRSLALARLIDATPQAMGSPRRKLQFQLREGLQGGIESWLAFIVSGALARLRIGSGTIDLPRRTGGTIACRWRYFAFPEADPDYHLLIFSPLQAGTRRRDGPVGSGSSLLGLLTAREREVVKLLLEGSSPEEIGQRLSLSVHTVRGHTRSIYVKLKVNSRPQLMATLARDAESIAMLEKLEERC